MFIRDVLYLMDFRGIDEKNQQKFPEMSPNVVICCILFWFESKGVLH